MKRNFQRERAIGNLQWHSKYWGSDGAVALAEEYYLEFIDEDPQTRFWMHMSLADVYYSAGSWARARIKINPFMALIWAWRACVCLRKAHREVEEARLLKSHIGSIGITVFDFNAMQTIYREYFNILWPKSLFRKQILLAFQHADWAIDKGLAMWETPHITICLLRIGMAEVAMRKVFLIHRPVIDDPVLLGAYATLINVWSMATDITERSVDIQQNPQLSRIFRNVGALATQLAPYVNVSKSEISPETLANTCFTLAKKYAETSDDQKSKLDAVICAT